MTLRQCSSALTFQYGSLRPKADSDYDKAVKQFHETVWKITASLILMKPAVDEKLIFALTRAPLKLFNAPTMKVRLDALYALLFASCTFFVMQVIVECWNWLLSARQDAEMQFLQEMVFAWHASQARGLGLFQCPELRYSPLAPDENMRHNLQPDFPDVEPHEVWIKFVQERIEVAKSCSQEQIILFMHMMQRTLDISVGREKPTMGRHAAAAGARYDNETAF